MLPSAEPERLGREEHVLADHRGLAEDVVAGLTLQNRQWQDLLSVEKSVFEPAFGTCRAKAVTVIDEYSCHRFRMHNGATPDRQIVRSTRSAMR